MKSILSILSDNEYVELMYFSEDILVVISIIFSMDLHHMKIRKIRARLKACGIINVRYLQIEPHLYVFNVNMISKYYVILEIQCCQITWSTEMEILLNTTYNRNETWIYYKTNGSRDKSNIVFTWTS
jgi:hypothetical protein